MQGTVEERHSYLKSHFKNSIVTELLSCVKHPVCVSLFLSDIKRISNAGTELTRLSHDAVHSYLTPNETGADVKKSCYNSRKNMLYNIAKMIKIWRSSRESAREREGIVWLASMRLVWQEPSQHTKNRTVLIWHDILPAADTVSGAAN